MQALKARGYEVLAVQTLNHFHRAAAPILEQDRWKLAFMYHEILSEELKDFSPMKPEEVLMATTSGSDFVFLKALAKTLQALGAVTPDGQILVEEVVELLPSDYVNDR